MQLAEFLQVELSAPCGVKCPDHSIYICQTLQATATTTTTTMDGKVQEIIWGT